MAQPPNGSPGQAMTVRSRPGLSKGLRLRRPMVLHIGSHRTGSTAIQFFLTQNRERLATQGFLVPATGCPAIAPTGHHEFAWAQLAESLEWKPDGTLDWLRNLDLTNRWAMLAHEVEAATADAVVLSSEEFVRLDAQAVRMLRAHLAIYDVKIIIYLREQVEFCESMYRVDVVSHREHRHFFDYWESMRDRLNYFSVLEKWADVFGTPHVRARLFQEDALAGHDVITDFCAEAGIRLTDEFELPPSKMNHGQPADVVLAMRLLREQGQRKEVINKLLNWSYRRRCDKPTDHQLVTRSQAHALMQEVAESNEMLRRRYFPERASMFTESIERPDEIPDEATCAARLLSEMLDAT